MHGLSATVKAARLSRQAFTGKARSSSVQVRSGAPARILPPTAHAVSSTTAVALRAKFKALGGLADQCNQHLIRDTGMYAHISEYERSLALDLVIQWPEYGQAEWEVAA
jgi:hypothetical protein